MGPTQVVQYTEANHGPQAAQARYTGQAGYSNALLKDGDAVQTMGPRAPLAVGAQRSQNMERISDENLVVQVRSMRWTRGTRERLAARGRGRGSEVGREGERCWEREDRERLSGRETGEVLGGRRRERGRRRRAKPERLRAKSVHLHCALCSLSPASTDPRLAPLNSLES